MTHDNNQTEEQVANNDAEPEAPASETKEERFIRLAVYRTQKTIDRVRLLRHLSNTSSYAYTDSQVDKLFAALRGEIDKTEAEFKKHTANDPMFTL